jgi:hypothetical protein
MVPARNCARISAHGGRCVGIRWELHGFHPKLCIAVHTEAMQTISMKRYALKTRRADTSTQKSVFLTAGSLRYVSAALLHALRDRSDAV